jgi:hypothetical protein
MLAKVNYVSLRKRIKVAYENLKEFTKLMSSAKEVNLRKSIACLSILMLLFSLNTLAKDAFSFEPREYPDSIIPEGVNGMRPFITGYRDSRDEDFSVVEGEKWWHGTHSVQIRMTHKGKQWNILAKNALESGQAESLDTTFLDDLDIGDTIYYYLYVPWNAHIDSIFLFVRNTAWAHEEHTVYYPSDLHYGRWNELKDGISKNNTDGDPFELPLIQSDFEIHTNPDVNPPACTLYWDCPSSKGKVPARFTDTAGQAGIEMPEPGDGKVNVAKGSINSIEYVINTAAHTPVMIQAFNLAGQKKLEIPVGIQAPGTYSFPITNLPAGVYLIRVVAGEDEGYGKAICLY